MTGTPQALGVFVNDKPHAVGAPGTLMGLLADLGLSQRRGIAAAVNGEVVPRGSWGTRALAEKDRVIVIRATQGG